ncbi:MAG: tRNA (adenosine(37)-N6)-threonylcarbamoyltransferase complex dimerization subunit type 1 TsaB [Thermodesulfobacteriota bacterium]
MTYIDSCTPNNYYLILNGVEDRLQIVIGSEQDVYYAWEMRALKQGMRYLPPAVEEGLQASGIDVSDLSGIACVRGPGNFTGLRIVLSIASGMNKGSGVPLAGLDYLPLLAMGPCQLNQGEVWVLTHARHELVFAQGFAAPGDWALSSPCALSLQEATAMLANRDRDIVVLGSGVRRNLQYIKQYLPQANILDSLWDRLGADTLLREALKLQYSQEAVQPLYLRKSDAEENIGQIAAKRGITPDEASKLLQP